MKSHPEPRGNIEIEYLSPAATVSMGDDWYELAEAEHFWMQRRLSVMSRLFRPSEGDSCIDIGCGHGVVQKQVADQMRLAVDGIDLNEFALKQNVALRHSTASKEESERRDKLYCYDVFDYSPQLESAYDHALLLDVLEHMDDDRAFLEASSFLIKPGGTIVVNVPAFMHLFSLYDVAVGHERRYAANAMKELAANAGLEVQSWTYWGAPLVPLLLARKVVLKFVPPERTVKLGFRPPSRLANKALAVYSKFEWLPQHIYGTSLMAVLRKPIN